MCSKELLTLLLPQSHPNPNKSNVFGAISLSLISQIGTSNFDQGEKMGLRYAPFAFTEQGVAQLSSVLSSERAIAVNIEIIRYFIKMREILLNQADVLKRLDQIEYNYEMQQLEIGEIFEALKALLNPAQAQRNPIGYNNRK